jgi:hypothetical protein
VNIAGYEDFPLIDGSPFMEDPLFWPTYLSALVTPTEEALVSDAFGVSEQDCEAFYDRITDSEAWPVFRLGLSDGHEIDVIFWNLPGDYNIDVVMCRRGGTHPLELAILAGHQFIPGLSWAEMVTAAQWTGAPYGVVDPIARLLLMIPAFGDRDVPDDAAQTLTNALTTCGAGAGVDDVVEYMLRKRGWRVHWRRNGDGALVNNGRYSRRNPDGPANLEPADLFEVSTALSA